MFYCTIIFLFILFELLELFEEEAFSGLLLIMEFLYKYFLELQNKPFLEKSFFSAGITKMWEE